MFARYKAYRKRQAQLRNLRRVIDRFEGKKRTIIVTIPIWVWLPALSALVYFAVR